VRGTYAGDPFRSTRKIAPKEGKWPNCRSARKGDWQVRRSGARKSRTGQDRRPFVSIADISFLTALLAGALSFLSPCVLPLVPPYLCYMAGISVEQFRGEGERNAGAGARRAVMFAAIAFTLGFATVFVALGAGASDHRRAVAPAHRPVGKDRRPDHHRHGAELPRGFSASASCRAKCASRGAASLRR